MKRRFVKVLTMLMLTGGLTLASAIVANGQSGQLKANVPFDFIIAEKTLRAGEYQVRAADTAGTVLAIRNADSGDSVLRLTNAAQRSRDEEMIAKLVFHRYGSTYFLSQVWMAGEQTGRELKKTSQERAIERELKAIAAYHGKNKPVYEVVAIVATQR